MQLKEIKSVKTARVSQTATRAWVHAHLRDIDNKLLSYNPLADLMSVGQTVDITYRCDNGDCIGL